MLISGVTELRSQGETTQGDPKVRAAYERKTKVKMTTEGVKHLEVTLGKLNFKEEYIYIYIILQQSIRRFIKDSRNSTTGCIFSLCT